MAAAGARTDPPGFSARARLRFGCRLRLWHRARAGLLESQVAAAEGVDISETMVALARAKCSRAQFKVGDILAQPQLLQNTTISSPLFASC